ncbi:MAG: 16S rRNA (uracil(1498)-N(3))-methyltransferase [Bacteroidales bacterium]|jgi:16S rRNA (uracil1498-N3)-methyltransferase|nr:16S rRNA (uracil(1498)-N(3))-methyltransferase [Bacteroidales bacterium]
MQLFYIPDFCNNDIYTLNKEESQHIVKVLRMKEGDNVFLTDGIGNLYKASIVEANPRNCIVKVEDKQEEYQKRDFYIHLAIAPTKNINRIEWLFEKITEMGIDEITPIITEHSERDKINNERLEKIIVSAMKQSLKAYKPKLNEITNFNTLLNNIKQENKYLAYCQGDDRILIKDDYQKGKSCLIIIGPEGDFSFNEIEKAKQNNIKLVSLGQQRLRTETAALFAVSNIHFLNQ